MLKRISAFLLALCALAAWPATAPAVPQTSSFTYQGRLDSNGSPANGTYSFRLRLFDALTNGTQIQTDQVYTGVAVANGLFAFTATFDATSFAGEARWLEVAVKGPSDGTYLNLPPRQPVNAVPYAVQALSGVANQWIYNSGHLTYPTGNVGVTAHASAFPVGTGNGVFFEGGWGAQAHVWAYNYDNNTPINLILNNNGGNVGIGQINPQGKLHVDSSSGAAIIGRHLSNWVGVYGESQSSVGVWGKSFTGIGVQGETGAGFNAGVIGYCSNVNGWGGYFQNTAGGVGLRVVGAAVVGTLDIAGGADIVEGFNTGSSKLEAGTVVVIDAARPGDLRASSSPYDTRVAGVVSGAGGIAPGLRISQKGKLDGDTPVAMSGRVYVRCSAENGPITPGDLLTSSATGGCAMRAGDSARSHGAVLGKAMGTLDHGTGLVLTLVNLQ